MTLLSRTGALGNKVMGILRIAGEIVNQAASTNASSATATPFRLWQFSKNPATVMDFSLGSPTPS
ncbi:MAG: hypothetical protein J5846_08445 [Desulfovibrio sp.]|nr:hypothetical protein [Desulfovibrio sp.]